MENNSDLGIIAVGGALTNDTLLLAYQNGIFPWPMEGMPVPWVCPPQRAILEFERLSIPRSFRQFLKKNRFSITLNQNFSQVIQHCQRVPRPGQSGTWITEAMKSAYTQLHLAGFSHSVEVWEDALLVGGLYGVSILGTFAGESMFHLRPNASKLALAALIGHLKAQGLTWIDIQMMTPHMKQWGARELSRDSFLELLFRTQKQAIPLSWKPQNLEQHLDLIR